MLNTDINNVQFADNEVVALMWGDNLVYRKVAGILAGSFSKSGNYSFKLNGISTPITLNSDLTFGIDDLKLTNCKNMFSDLSYLKTITSFPDMSHVTTTNVMFAECVNLVSVDFSAVKNTKSLTNMTQMFGFCEKLETIIFGNFDLQNVTRMHYMFEECSELQNVSGNIHNIKVSFDLGYCPKLTHASAKTFINALSELEETQNITFNPATFSIMTDEEIALATSLGWSVVSAVSQSM